MKISKNEIIVASSSLLFLLLSALLWHLLASFGRDGQSKFVLLV